MHPKFQNFLSGLLYPDGADRGEELLKLFPGSGEGRLGFKSDEFLTDAIRRNNLGKNVAFDTGNIIFGKARAAGRSRQIAVDPQQASPEEKIDHLVGIFRHSNRHSAFLRFVDRFIAPRQDAAQGGAA